MASKSNKLQIEKFNVTGKEIGIFVSITFILGITILFVTWKFMGGDLFPSPINLIETSQTGEMNLPMVSNVSVSDVNNSSATISWQTNSPGLVHLKYGYQEYNLIESIDVPSGINRATLSSLLPNSRYFFQLTIVSGLNTSATTTTYSFVTSKK